MPKSVRQEKVTLWAICDALLEHRYDTRSSGSKPNAPGWHVCSCGAWEGYWCSFESEHLAPEILRKINDQRREI